jgi:phosphoribosylanthranilate isomerase
MILKVCGVTNQEDADVAVDAGANAIGFNFYAKSPRYVPPDGAARITTPMGVLRVGIFVNPASEEIYAAQTAAGLHVAQLHGDQPNLAQYLAIRLWKACQVRAGFDLAREDYGAAEALVLDGPAGDLYGGSGKSFDWRVASGLNRRIIVAGGLDGGNVARAVEIAKPWGVDACSRIESAPGKKDHQKMREYLWAARMALQS